MSNGTALGAPWGEHTLPSGETVRLEVGPLLVWARSTADEVWMAHAPGDGTAGGRRSGPDTREPADEDWVRWPVRDGVDRLILSPVFPPRPVVAEPDRSFRLLPRTRARIFVSVPLWVRASLPGGGERTLTEVPTLTLSDTWWGSVTEGEHGYWLRTSARRRAPTEVARPHLAVCPLELANRSDEVLPVERIVLRVAHLSLFVQDGALWADETRVRYRGIDEESEIEVSGERPSEVPEAERVAEPQRPPPPRGFRAQTVARLKSLPGLGGH